MIINLCNGHADLDMLLLKIRVGSSANSTEPARVYARQCYASRVLFSRMETEIDLAPA